MTRNAKGQVLILLYGNCVPLAKHMKIITGLIICLGLFTKGLVTRPTDSNQYQGRWNYMLLADFYYAYDFGKPATTIRQEAFCSYNRHNTPALNAGIAKLSYDAQQFRFRLGAVAGTYSADNYANEPSLLKHLFEAQAALKVSRSHDLWLHLGAFPSHIGFESALANENHTLSRSLLAENTPYFLSGAQLRYNHTKQWQFALLLLNGWQRIHWRNDQRLPSIGTQIMRQTERLQWNWSSFTGRFDPDSLRLWRSFHNFYLIYQPQPKIWLTFGLDVGWQEQPNGWAQWYSPVIIARYKSDRPWSFAGRVEYYHDPMAAHLRFSAPVGFKAWGGSVNVDRKVGPAGLLRAELRYLHSPNNALNAQSANRQRNLTAMVSLVIRLENDFSWL